MVTVWPAAVAPVRVPVLFGRKAKADAPVPSSIRAWVSSMAEPVVVPASLKVPSSRKVPPLATDAAGPLV